MKIRGFTAFVVILTALFTRETRGNTAYLKLTGPTPLRFSVALAIPAIVMLPDSLRSHPAATNTVATNLISTASIATNTVTSPSEATAGTPDHPAVLNPDPQNSTPSVPAASDMLVVSPQMLTEYFKPAADGTNAVGTVVVPLPVPVGFTPPSAKASSRATYHSP